MDRPLEDIAHILTAWLHGKSPRTAEAYRIAVRDLLHSAGTADVRAVRLEDLQAWDREMEARGLAASSRRTRLAAAKSLLKFCQQQGLTERNAGAQLRVPSARDALAERILSEDELGRLVEAAARGTHAERDRFLVRLLYAAALRVSELCGLRWRDVVPLGGGRGQLIVFGKGGKTGIVVIGGALWVELERRRSEALAERGLDGLICPLTRQRLWQIVRAASNRAGLGKAVSPHWCRHAHASHAIERGAPISVVQSTLRHSNVATTSRYLHARPSASSSSYLPGV